MRGSGAESELLTTNAGGGSLANLLRPACLPIRQDGSACRYGQME